MHLWCICVSAKNLGNGLTCNGDASARASISACGRVAGRHVTRHGGSSTRGSSCLGLCLKGSCQAYSRQDVDISVLSA